jgi:hypothetical protein
MMRPLTSLLMRSTLVVTASLAACAKVTSGAAGAGDAGAPPAMPPTLPAADAGARHDGGTTASGPEAGTPLPGDPTTCAQAAQGRTYVGCDYWPTVVANNVWSIFDYAVVVANGQAAAASVTVTGPNGVGQSTTVAPGSLAKIYLPWVAALKGPDTDTCGSAIALPASVLSIKGAYHLVSSVPVTVYQFNALEYRGQGGPAGKSWASCPGRQICEQSGAPSGCYSFSNDASLLLPSTAMTGNYRVIGIHGWSEVDSIGGLHDVMGGYFAITATQDGTTVKVRLSGQGQALAGGAIAAAGANGVLTLALGQGDVAEVVTPVGSRYDLSGSLVSADKPVQVLAGIPCIDLPQGKQSCDHVEESVLPAETLGKHYFVTVPTSPTGVAVGHVVRLYGNVDGTTLSYAPTRPSGCPTALNAGQVADCGTVSDDFEVRGDHELGVASFMLGAEVVDPQPDVTMEKGDPSMSIAVAVEQYRTKYVFLAPDDYDVSFVDIVGPSGVQVALDGAPLLVPFTPLGSTGYGVARVQLGAGQAGAHVMASSAPVGIQVMGYGFATSYQVPGGLNLTLIAPPPPVVQ